MSENPYQAPSSNPNKPPVIGVNSGDFADLLGIAKAQKGIMICILIYFVAVVGQFMVPIQIRPFVGIGVLLVGLVGAFFVFSLATKVYPMAAGIVMGLLTLVPCLGLVALLIVNAKGTKVLKQNGFDVGLMGADMSQF